MLIQSGSKPICILGKEDMQERIKLKRWWIACKYHNQEHTIASEIKQMWIHPYIGKHILNLDSAIKAPKCLIPYEFSGKYVPCTFPLIQTILEQTMPALIRPAVFFPLYI